MPILKTIAELRKRIVETQVKHEDTSGLEKELKAARLEEATQKEVAELQQVADKRLQWQKEATRIMGKVESQDKAITTFLTARDRVTKLLKEAVDLARAEGLLKLGDECFAEFHDPFSWGETVKRLPKGYLPDSDFGCPSLEMASGTDYAYNKVREAVWYLNAAHGLLANLKKGRMMFSLKEVDDLGDGDL